MPQLMPHPWFYIFFFSWLILFFFTPKKMSSHMDSNDPAYLAQDFQHKAWTWPW